MRQLIKRTSWPFGSCADGFARNSAVARKASGMDADHSP